MSVVSTVTDINSQVATYAPLVMVGVQAAEQSTAAGQDKKQSVIDGINAASKVMEGVPVPQVAAIGGLIDMFTSIFNALGMFKHKTPAAT